MGVGRGHRRSVRGRGGWRKRRRDATKRRGSEAATLSALCAVIHELHRRGGERHEELFAGARRGPTATVLRPAVRVTSSLDVSSPPLTRNRSADSCPHGSSPVVIGRTRCFLELPRQAKLGCGKFIYVVVQSVSLSSLFPLRHESPILPPRRGTIARALRPAATFDTRRPPRGFPGLVRACVASRVVTVLAPPLLRAPSISRGQS